jgi:hypothetical protein
MKKRQNRALQGKVSSRETSARARAVAVGRTTACTYLPLALKGYSNANRDLLREQGIEREGEEPVSLEKVSPDLFPPSSFYTSSSAPLLHIKHQLGQRQA